MVYEQSEDKIKIPLAISQVLAADYMQPTVLIDARTSKGKRMCCDYEETQMNARLNVIVVCWIGDISFIKKLLKVASVILVEVIGNIHARVDSFFLEFLPWKGTIFLVMGKCWNDERTTKKRMNLRYRIEEEQVWFIYEKQDTSCLNKMMLEVLSLEKKKGRNYEGSF